MNAFVDCEFLRADSSRLGTAHDVRQRFICAAAKLDVEQCFPQRPRGREAFERQVQRRGRFAGPALGSHQLRELLVPVKPGRCLSQRRLQLRDRPIALAHRCSGGRHADEHRPVARRQRQSAFVQGAGVEACLHRRARMAVGDAHLRRREPRCLREGGQGQLMLVERAFEQRLPLPEQRTAKLLSASLHQWKGLFFLTFLERLAGKFG